MCSLVQMFRNNFWTFNFPEAYSFREGEKGKYYFNSSIFRALVKCSVSMR
jgi:hypothetical protein